MSLNEKWCVVNVSGNTGKSTFSQHLAIPRMPGSQYFAVESINSSDDMEGETIRGKQFGDLQEELMLLDSAVVDVGASNAEDFLKVMSSFVGSHEDFDRYIVPTVKEAKQIRDTITTIAALNALGVPASKIHVVFNKLDVDEEVSEAFHPLFLYHKDKAAFTLEPAATIRFSELYQRLRDNRTTIPQLLSDQTDYKAALKEARAAGNMDEAERCVAMISMKRLALGAVENLDTVFAAIVSPKTKSKNK